MSHAALPWVPVSAIARQESLHKPDLRPVCNWVLSGDDLPSAVSSARQNPGHGAGAALDWRNSSAFCSRGARILDDDITSESGNAELRASSAAAWASTLLVRKTGSCKNSAVRAASASSSLSHPAKDSYKLVFRISQMRSGGGSSSNCRRKSRRSSPRQRSLGIMESGGRTLSQHEAIEGSSATHSNSVLECSSTKSARSSAALASAAISDLDAARKVQPKNKTLGAQPIFSIQLTHTPSLHALVCVGPATCRSAV